MTPTTRELALRYRANIRTRRELREALGPLLRAARPLGWATLARLTHLPPTTLRRLAAAQPPTTLTGHVELEPPLPLNRATLTRLARAGRRLAKLTAEQREQRVILGDAVRVMHSSGDGWHIINNRLGGRSGGSTAWVLGLSREPQGTGRRRPPTRPLSDDHRQAVALGKDTTTLTLLRIPDPTPGVRALLAARLQRYPALDPARIARIAGIPPPARGGGGST